MRKEWPMGLSAEMQAGSLRSPDRARSVVLPVPESGSSRSHLVEPVSSLSAAYRTGPRTAATSGFRGPFLKSRRPTLVSYPVMAVLVSLMRARQIRERREKRLLIRVDAVAKQIVRRPIGIPGAESKRFDDRPDDRTVAAREGSQLDVGDVVLEPTAIRESGEVPGEHAE